MMSSHKRFSYVNTRMETNCCWYRLNIDTSRAFRDDYVLPTVSTKHEVWEFPVKDVFDSKWIEYMDSIGLHMSFVLVFYRPAGFKHSIAHVDLNEKTSKATVYAVNLIVHGKDSQMVWYDLPQSKLEIQYTARGVPYIAAPMDELREIQRSYLGNELALVRVNMPHAIFCGDEDRWCFSLRFSQEYPTWNAVVDRYLNAGLIAD